MADARIMMWANFRRKVNVAVPAPFDDNSSPYWWYDRISEWAHSWAVHGITDVLFPNPIKGESGAYRTGDGYNPFDDYDAGSKNQLGRMPTRFGTAEQLRRAVAICRANGIAVHIDHVMHQRMGGKNGVYRYLSADGKSETGRFPKDPGCFRGDPPRVPEDPVPSPQDDYEFGEELCPVNSQPKGYVWDGLIAAGDWLFRTLGVQGARLDDMKGMNQGFIHTFMTSAAMKDKFFFGEYASGNPDDLNWWVGQVQGRASAIDFGFHYNRAQPMCNDAGGSGFWMSSLGNRNNAMIGSNPMRAVPFVESMDSDTNGFATIVNNKALAYALMLGGEGLPMIYIRDYLQEQDCYGLKPIIDNLMWCHQNLANGPTVTRYADAKTFVFERTGHPNMLCALNNSVWDPSWHTVTVQTGFGPNVQLHDYTGHNGTDCWTDADGKARFGIPPGANGMGFGCWSRAGLSAPIAPHSFSTTQTFFGAADLDIPQALNGNQTIGRIWVEAGSPIETVFTVDTTGWIPTAGVTIDIRNANGVSVEAHAFTITDKSVSTGGQAVMAGWHTLNLSSAGLPATGSEWTWKVTYTAPKTISKEQF